MLYTLPCQLLQIGLPLRPFMTFICDGVTLCSVGTPLKSFDLDRDAQSMGEWPGASNTFPRPDEPARCWLLLGGPLFGRGPFDGTRNPFEGAGSDCFCVEAFVGGGIRPAVGAFSEVIGGAWAATVVL